jgi:hypothetical protein
MALWAALRGSMIKERESVIAKSLFNIGILSLVNDPARKSDRLLSFEEPQLCPELADACPGAVSIILRHVI